MRSLLLVLVVSSSVIASPIEEWDDDIRATYLEAEVKLEVACVSPNPDLALSAVLAEVNAVVLAETTVPRWEMINSLTVTENQILRETQLAEISYRIPMWASVKTSIITKAKCL